MVFRVLKHHLIVADFPITPPMEPMLSKAVDAIPAGPFLYEPKWDGFRAIVFRGGGGVYIQSRDGRSTATSPSCTTA
jgi:ATP-dependent DNA ligase